MAKKKKSTVSTAAKSATLGKRTKSKKVNALGRSGLKGKKGPALDAAQRQQVAQAEAGWETRTGSAEEILETGGVDAALTAAQMSSERTEVDRLYRR
jgi:hypothetical protein